jgi:hypothetical protein
VSCAIGEAVSRVTLKGNTVELSLSGLIGTESYPDKQKTRIIEFFFENMLNRQFEDEKIFLQTAVLGHIFIHVQIKH